MHVNAQCFGNIIKSIGIDEDGIAKVPDVYFGKQHTLIFAYIGKVDTSMHFDNFDGFVYDNCNPCVYELNYDENDQH